MSEINPNALSLESDQTTLESQPTTQEPAEPDPQQAAPDDDALPEGVTDPTGTIGPIIAAERKRARAAAERAVREREVAPLQAKAQEADQLRAVLAELRPIVEDVRKYGLPKAPPPSKAEDLVSDEEAAAEARDLELYDSKTGQPDLARAKRIIARRRSDVQTAVTSGVQAAVGPITSQTAQSQSRQNFVSMAMAAGPDGQPIAPPNSPQVKLMAELWTSLPPELTAHQEVAELVRDAALGKHLRTTGRVPRAERAPVFSEPAGGRSGPSFEMDRMAKSLAKNAGISDADFKKTATAFQPGATNVLGD